MGDEVQTASKSGANVVQCRENRGHPLLCLSVETSREVTCHNFLFPQMESTCLESELHFDFMFLDRGPLQ